MSSSIQDFHDYIIQDAMDGIPGITSKRMFGGYGIYQDGVIFAIITSDTELYFKTDDKLKPQFEAINSEPFVYTGHKNRKPTEMPYWLLPEEILEDREKLADWVNASVAASKRTKKK